MLTTALPRRILAAGLMVGALALGGCDDDDDSNGTGPVEVEVGSMLIDAGTQEVTVSATGAITGGPLTFDVGPRDVTVSFFDDLGAPIDPVDLGDYIADAENTTPGVLSVTRTGDFTFTITGTNSGAGSVSFSLFHVDEEHDDFGPFPVPITIAGGGGGA